MDRRDFLKAGLGLAAFAPMPIPAPWARAQGTAQTSPVAISAATRTLDIRGKSAKVLGLLQSGGLQGVRIDGDTFDVALTNTLGDETLIHWHGQTPPNELDGVPNEPAPMMKPGETRRYTFKAGVGTHWMHAHTLQEQTLLAAPLIVRSPEDLKADMQEVVVLLHDFSFKTPEELLAGLTGGEAKPIDHAGMNHGSMPMGGGAMPMAGMNRGSMPMGGGMPGMSGMPGMGGGAMGGMNHGAMGHGAGGMAMDLNDITYDAFLANDRTLEDPEVVKVEKGGRVRLRIINGASSTAFTLDTGTLRAALVAVDGQAIQPLEGTRFPLTMGQRIDLVLNVPAAGGAFPVLALVEGLKARTGIVLATQGAQVARLVSDGRDAGPVVGLDLETRLAAAAPLALRKPDREFRITLTGDMATYQWGLLGADALKVAPGQRIEIAMRNMSMMAHPMHLHGHHFQVVAINGKRFSGALRDTVVVPPMAEVTIAFDAGTPGRWAFHCHHLYHMVTGMMSFVAVA